MKAKVAKGGAASEAGARARTGREELAEPVGEGLRRQREAAGMSLRALARSVGVSPSLISQIEHGKATPSVATLYAIVSELDISMDELFFDRRPGGAGTATGERRYGIADRRRWARDAPDEGPVLRAADRPCLGFASGVRWERLTAAHDPGVEFLYCTYPVGGESAPTDKPTTHEGSEYGVILEGRCGATVGDDYYELDAGDSIAFDSRIPHRIWNLGDDRPMVAIWTVVGREGDPRDG